MFYAMLVFANARTAQSIRQRLIQLLYNTSLSLLEGKKDGETYAIGLFLAQRFDVGSPYALILPPSNLVQRGSALILLCMLLNQLGMELGANTSA